MEIDWHFFTNDDAEDTVNEISAAVIKKMGIPVSTPKIEPYENFGVIIKINSPVSVDSWSSAVLDALVMGQKLGRSWHLAGNIEQELDAWSTESIIPGITQIHLMLFPGEK